MPLSDDELTKLFLESVEGEPSDQETEEIGKMIQALSATDGVRRLISGEPRPTRDAETDSAQADRKK